MSATTPLACQRELFEVPRQISYLDAAAWTLLPRTVREAGEAGLLTKSRPWTHPRAHVPAWTERARRAAAVLVGADASDIAIVGSISHAIATVAANLMPPPGTRILRVAEEFPSHCYAWDRMAAARGLIVEIVARPQDDDWTSALLEAIRRPGAAPLAVAALSPLHWSDGSLIDLDVLAPAVRAVGAALVVDATQAVGATPIDVARLQPDFLAFPAYKWALGPYSAAFLYAAPHRQTGVPLEENNGNRAPEASGARRYDRGELNDPVLMPMAATGMELLATWTVPAVTAYLRRLTDALAHGVTTIGLGVLPERFRAPHILGVRVPSGLPPDLMERLADVDVFASVRQGTLRLSPHLWVDDDDVEHCLTALRTILGR